MQDTYIEQAWAEHAAKLSELNRLLVSLYALQGKINKVEAELEELARKAKEALPWGPEVEGGLQSSASSWPNNWKPEGKQT